MEMDGELIKVSESSLKLSKVLPIISTMFFDVFQSEISFLKDFGRSYGQIDRCAAVGTLCCCCSCRRLETGFSTGEIKLFAGQYGHEIRRGWM